MSGNKNLYVDNKQRIRNANIDIIKINQWLKGAGLKEKIEGLTTAALDQTWNYHANIKEGSNEYVDSTNKRLKQLTS